MTQTDDFGTYGFLVARFKREGREARFRDLIMAGTCSAVVASVVLCPIDRAKILLQVQRPEEASEGRREAAEETERRYSASFVQRSK